MHTQSLINRLTYKAVSIVNKEWIEGSPFFSSLGQVGLANPKEFTNIYPRDNIGENVVAVDFFCVKVFPQTICQGLDVFVRNDYGELDMLFECDIIQFTHNDESVIGYIDYITGTYVIANVDDSDNPKLLCRLDELNKTLENNKFVLEGDIKIIGNIFDNFNSEELNLKSDFEKREFSQMIYQHKSKYIS